MMIIPNIWKHNPNVPNHQPGMYMSHDKTGTFYQKHMIKYLQNGRMVIAISTNQWKWITPLQLLFWTEWESMSPMFLDILTTDSIPCPTIGWYGSDKPLNGVRSCSWIYKQVLHVNLCKTCLMNVLRDCKSQFHALMLPPARPKNSHPGNRETKATAGNNASQFTLLSSHMSMEISPCIIHFLLWF